MTPIATARALDVAVVGAGLSGLVCARMLADRGQVVRIFEKARGAGGRMSTRRAGFWSFDHGAQYFTVRTSRFAHWVEAWLDKGKVASWEGEIAVLESGRRLPCDDQPERFVGVPGMSAICRHLAADLEVMLETRVVNIDGVGDRWRLDSEDGNDLGRFDAVVVSAPAPQTAELLARASPAMARRAGAVEMAPCWAVMAGFAAPLELGLDGAFVHGSPLSWVARNASKPGRRDSESWVLHASPDWSRQHIEHDGEDTSRRLLDAFRAAVGGLGLSPIRLDSHRWRFALPQEPLPDRCLFEPESRLAACGDWCGGPRVEGAFLSGYSAAERILELQSGGAPSPRPGADS